MIKNIAQLLCKLAGHHWHYKDYFNWKKENGDNYDFKASRNCSRCNQSEYLYEDWKMENKKSPYDIKNLCLSAKHISLLLKAYKLV